MEKEIDYLLKEVKEEVKSLLKSQYNKNMIQKDQQRFKVNPIQSWSSHGDGNV